MAGGVSPDLVVALASLMISSISLTVDLIGLGREGTKASQAEQSPQAITVAASQLPQIEAKLAEALEDLGKEQRALAEQVHREVCAWLTARARP